MHDGAGPQVVINDHNNTKRALCKGIFCDFYKKFLQEKSFKIVIFLILASIYNDFG